MQTISLITTKIKSFFIRILWPLKRLFRSIRTFSARKPILSFLGLLGVLLLVIIIGNTIRKPKVDPQPSLEPKAVSTIKIGEQPTITVQAKIDKSGVITISALTPGIVSSISVKEGDSVTKGKQVVALASNYQGGNSASVARQLAQSQYASTQETSTMQRDIIAKQRDLAAKSQENVDALRAITAQSIESSQSLINLTKESIDLINQGISQMTNPGDIAQAKQGRLQLESSLAQQEAALRQTQYQAVGENPPGRMAYLQKEITDKQLDMQEKTLQLGLDAARLQLKLAQITEAQFYPASPVNGTVDRVFVHVGQQVNPGTPLVSVSGNSQDITAIALVNQTIAQQVSQTDPSTIEIGSETLSIVPTYISHEPTDGQLFSIIYPIDDAYKSQLTNNGYVTIHMPLGLAQPISATPIIPIDAVFQSETQAYVYVAENGKAVSKNVTLGQVQGSYVEVKSGLTANDEVILTRGVVNNDPIKKEGE